MSSIENIDDNQLAMLEIFNGLAAETDEFERYANPHAARVATIADVFYAELICSDERCTDRFWALGTLNELQALSCDCGFGLVIVSLAEADGAGLEVTPMRGTG